MIQLVVINLTCLSISDTYCEYYLCKSINSLDLLSSYHLRNETTPLSFYSFIDLKVNRLVMQTYYQFVVQ